MSVFAVSLSAVEIIAHRGASHDAPENTLAAVRLGWERGSDAVEIDVHLSKDGRVVLLHDKTTKRTAGVDRKVSEQTLAELNALDAGRWKGMPWAGERIPAIDEVLETIPDGKRLFIEIKSGPEILDELEAVIKRSGKSAEQLVIIGFSFDTMKLARGRFPEIPVFWLSSFEEAPSGGWTPGREELIFMAKSAGFDGLNLSHKGPVDAAFVKAAHDAGLKLYVWTVDDPQIARRLVADGVDGITTNRPKWLRERLE
jgi:glycerophosphoryl diester phosphodiesterase